MTVKTHVLGYPRIGDKRQTKFALERYWKGSQDKATTIESIDAVFKENIRSQIEAGLSIVTTGDFAHYDLVLTLAVAFGVHPERFAGANRTLDPFDRQFYYARGRDHTGCFPDTTAWQMTKWFDTNYHYMVPELAADEKFDGANFAELLKQVEGARAVLAAAGSNAALKMVLVGPVSFLYLSSTKSEKAKASLLPALLAVYKKLLGTLAAAGVNYVQMDEPVLCLDLDSEWQNLFGDAYRALAGTGPDLLVATYFETVVGKNRGVVCDLPVMGVHIDTTRCEDPKQYVAEVADSLDGTGKVLSVGVVDGRSVWTTDQGAAKEVLTAAHEKVGGRLWVGSGSSLLHLPVDIACEKLPAELEGKLAFAKQKLGEVVTCGRLASGEKSPDVKATGLKLTPAVKKGAVRSGAFKERFAAQMQSLKLPLLPTTTIGSFPQTAEIRTMRSALKSGKVSEASYKAAMKKEIQRAVEEQEKLELDVLVHGEAERTDMVEYFAQYMEGFWVAENSWVQSFGSRCVRPPIVVGDIKRSRAMTVEWISFAQSLTKKPMKAMLTGPVTILNWSFAPSSVGVRDVLRLQLAEAIKDEVADLQEAGIRIMQIDEPAFREGLPLKKGQQAHYWDEAVNAFKHCASSAKPETQIHTHMCYSSFHDCLERISEMDADVITIETARSGLQLLDAFKSSGYNNSIGPGVYDIHSPCVPDSDAMQVVIAEAKKYVPVERLWVNPDCGLKTRGWEETRGALQSMVKMAKAEREAALRQ